VLAALNAHWPERGSDDTPIADMLERVVVARDRLLITIAGTAGNDPREIRVKWSPKPRDSATAAPVDALREETRNQGLIQSVARAHAWLRSLCDGTYASVELLAAGIGLHPKVVRQALRLAFLMPDVTSAILEGRQPVGLSLAQIPKALPLSWTEHRRLLG
jgi:site-specific DNA recombinase